MSEVAEVQRDDDYAMFAVFCHSGPHAGRYLDRWIEGMILPEESCCAEDGALLYSTYECAVAAMEAYEASIDRPEAAFCAWAIGLAEQSNTDVADDWLSPTHIVKMCGEIPTMDDPLKQHRWIGFIQAALVANKAVDRETMRIKSAELFKQIPRDRGS